MSNPSLCHRQLPAIAAALVFAVSLTGALACSANDPASSGGSGASAGTAGASAGGASAGAAGAAQGGGGSGGASGSGGSAGSATAGSSNAGSGGAAGSSAGGTGGGSSPGACPDAATFCSGFEEAGIPTGASYRPAYQAGEWATRMALDTEVFNSGAQALRVNPGADGYDWRMLSVAAPGPTFWVRLYVRSDADLGQAEHNAFFQAMTGDGEPNTGDNVEVAEQYCQIVLNLHDDVVLSTGGATMCGSAGKLLPKDEWHCMEAFFDGPNGAVQVYADGETIIDKSAWTTLSFQSFSFGFLSFHGPARTMWYDDVAVASTRIGCP